MEPAILAPAPSVSTTFTVVNLHCSSCVAQVEEALGALSPPPTSISHSIIHHSVTIIHPNTLSAATLSKTLDNAGFELYPEVPSRPAPLVESKEQAVQRWVGFLSPRIDSGKREKHLETCQLCRSKDSEPGTKRCSSSSSLSDPCCPLVASSCEKETLSSSPKTESSHLASVAVAPVDAATDTYIATLAITGMTCSACSGSITHALEAEDFVESSNINLISHSATVRFRNIANRDKLTRIVEDIGFEARLHDLECVDGEHLPNPKRQVAVHVNGMFCPECPGRVSEALAQLSTVAILRTPTLEHPVVDLEYTPKLPELTIRTILDTISSIHPSFAPSLHRQQSLEERSRGVHVRERRNILLRLVLSFVIAIPTFVIGIVYMDLIGSGNNTKKFLMEPLSGVRRADWALFALATPVYFFAADLFHRRTFKELRALWRRRSPTPLARRFYRFGSMNMLVCFGTSIAYWSSVAELGILAAHPAASPDLLNSNPFYFDSVVFLTMFLLFGRLIEAVSKAKTGDAVSALSSLRPEKALLIGEPETGNDGSLVKTQLVSADLLEIGDKAIVVQGSSPPRDGIITEGSTTVDESSLTGESKLVSKTRDDAVFAGTVVRGSPITVRITGPAGASMLDQIMAVVREGQAKRAPMERMADLLTAYFVPFVTASALATWSIWLALGFSGTLPDDWMDLRVGGWAFWSLQFAIAVFVIACPCGLGLAAPTALFVGGGLAARRGILVKGGGEAFQEASRLDVVAFDKTGTLTVGDEPTIYDSATYLPPNEALDGEALSTAVRTLEEHSSHPVARALVSHHFSPEPSDEVIVEFVEEIAGKGMKGTIQISKEKSIEILAGNESLMSDYDVSVSDEQLDRLGSWKARGCSVALVAVKQSSPDAVGSTTEGQYWHLCAVYAVSDRLRPEAPAVVEALQTRGIAVWMISGDNAATANAVGKQVGIPPSNIIAGVLPTGKADKVKYLQRSQPRRRSRPAALCRAAARAFGLPLAAAAAAASSTGGRPLVAFVGDGINDAPALAAADVSVAIGSGSDVALASASFVLLASDLRALSTLLDLSRAVFRRVRANFAWALMYNLVALPVAAGALYAVRSDGKHVRLDPAWAALAMAASSVSVVLSSLALRTRIPLLGFRERSWPET